MSTTDRPPRTSDPRAWGVYLRSRRFSLELADSRAFHVDDVYDRSDDKRALEQSKAIDSTNCKHHNAEQEKTKLLLLGAGESGKSTVFKQFQILYGTEFTPSQLEVFRAAIHENVHETMRGLCQAIREWEWLIEPSLMPAFQLILSAKQLSGGLLTSEEADAIHTLWHSALLQKAWERRAELQVIETASIFIERLDCIMEFAYVPSRDDVLHTRLRTIGIREERYIIDGSVFEMYDVGGQRNERKKWIHVFDGVNAVIFVAALSEYDQWLVEDQKVNRMVEAIELFDMVCNISYFDQTSMILFLNKKDIYAKKVLEVSIASVLQFSDYSSNFNLPPYDYDAGISYFRDKFLSVKKNSNKEIYCHVTCATDTQQVEVIFSACREIIVRENLTRNGFVN